MSIVECEKRSCAPDFDFSEKKIITNSPEETLRVGEKFAGRLKPGSVVALIGDLGSGKTTFIKGVCRGLNVVEESTSPTFTLINEYTGKFPVYHFDFYRIEKASEIYEIGSDEYFYDSGVCLIEWADKVIDFLPKNRIEIYLKNCYREGLENTRKIVVREL